MKETPRRGDQSDIDSSKQILLDKDKRAANDEDSEAEAQLQQVSANMEKMEKLATSAKSAKRHRSSGGMRLTLTSTEGSPRGDKGTAMDDGNVP